MIKVVIFDLDETLVEERAVDDDALRATGEFAREKRGLDVEVLRLAVRQNARRLWCELPTIEYTRSIGISSAEGLWGDFTGRDPRLQSLRELAPHYRQDCWQAALAEQEINDPDFAYLLARRFADDRRQRHRVFPDAEPVLQKLQGAYHLALLTNGAPCVQRAKITASGLNDYFNPIIISGGYGVGKPHPRIFERTLIPLAIPPEEAVMVGDNIKCDVFGAQQFGIRGIWLNRDGASSPDEITPDAVIASLHELPDVLD